MHESSNRSASTSSREGGDVAFHRLFGAPADVRAEAPGSVTLAGAHDGLHGGIVLAAVLRLRTRVALRRREDRTVRAYSGALGGEADVFTIGTERPGLGWLDYVQGATCVLREHGALMPGFDVRIDSDLPIGAGVGASAALVVSLLRALRTLGDVAIDDVEIARLAHRVETHFVGAPIGIATQMACSLGRPGDGLFLDTRRLLYDDVPWPRTAELVVIDAGLPQGQAGADGVVRRRESVRAAEALGVDHLGDVDAADLTAVDALPDPLSRRARHVITERQRALDIARAFRHGDVESAGRLLATSHASMRDDYDASTPELDTLVSLGQSDPAILGARMTGGFGACVVMLARSGLGRIAADRIARAYETRTHRSAAVLAPPAAARAAGA